MSPRPIGRFPSLCNLLGISMTPFHYTETDKDYLERMFQESDDLTTVDVFTVPGEIDPDSPRLLEWASFE